jgi:hypothetical protein
VTEPLWTAVDALTKPRTVRLLRDGAPSDWAHLPSLWAQLVEAVATGSEQGGGGRSSRYRTPANLDCLELATTIRDITLDALAGHAEKPVTHPGPPAVVRVPESLRRLASVVVGVGEDDLTGWWTYRIGSWGRQITTVLRLTERPQPRRVRDTACPLCHATHVILTTPEGLERVPALLVDFQDQLIRAAECSACGASWFRGDQLDALKGLLATRPLPPDADNALDVVC